MLVTGAYVRGTRLAASSACSGRVLRVPAERRHRVTLDRAASPNLVQLVFSTPSRSHASSSYARVRLCGRLPFQQEFPIVVFDRTGCLGAGSPRCRGASRSPRSLSNLLFLSWLGAKRFARLWDLRIVLTLLTVPGAERAFRRAVPASSCGSCVVTACMHVFRLTSGHIVPAGTHLPLSRAHVHVVC